jgi:hypothetical protein
MYLLSEDFFVDLAARLHGPMSMRFLLQPAVAIALGIRDGIKDAKAGTPPFIYDLIFTPKDRQRQLKSAFKTLLKPIIVAIVLDVVVQFLMFGFVWPGAAILVGVFLMGLPYALARGISNRIMTRVQQRRKGTS